ncbi:MAG TPA: sensor histidine kinase, partial [Candidatus Faecalibacterium intestinigallinarum]|nr:sensor histidine kinase [Candidatus Faecalibacterium intestinigallinarum]
MSFDFVRRMSLRRQILWGTQLFTAVVSLLVGAVLFAVSDSYIRTTTLRSVEFNLQQMAASVQSSLDTARNLLNWASTDSTLRRYLT